MNNTAEQRVLYDTEGVRASTLRQAIDAILSRLEAHNANGRIWRILQENGEFTEPGPILLVCDFNELPSQGAWDRLRLAAAPLQIVALVRTKADERSLASPETAVRTVDDRLAVLDVKAAGRSGALRLATLEHYLREVVGRLAPDRIRRAVFALADGVLWVEFGDGLLRAFPWKDLPFARAFAGTPVAAGACHHGHSVVFRKNDGQEFEVSAETMRALGDKDYRDTIREEDAAEREALGAALRVLRQTAKLTQLQMADRSGIPQASLSRLESGKRDPRLSTLQKYAAGLGMSMEEMLQALE